MAFGFAQPVQRHMAFGGVQAPSALNPAAIPDTTLGQSIHGLSKDIQSLPAQLPRFLQPTPTGPASSPVNPAAAPPVPPAVAPPVTSIAPAPAQIAAAPDVPADGRGIDDYLADFFGG